MAALYAQNGDRSYLTLFAGDFFLLDFFFLAAIDVYYISFTLRSNRIVPVASRESVHLLHLGVLIQTLRPKVNRHVNP